MTRPWHSSDVLDGVVVALKMTASPNVGCHDFDPVVLITKRSTFNEFASVYRKGRPNPDRTLAAWMIKRM